MKKVKSVLYHPSGARQEVSPKDGRFFSYEELRDFVGGMIEIVSLDNGLLMVVNEEGKLLNLPSNMAATVLFNAGERLWYDEIAGSALVCDASLLQTDDDDDDDPDPDDSFIPY